MLGQMPNKTTNIELWSQLLHSPLPDKQCPSSHPKGKSQSKAPEDERHIHC